MAKHFSTRGATGYAVDVLERRVLLAAGDPDPNFGTGGFSIGTGAPVEKLLVTPSGLFSLTRTAPGAASDIDVIKVLPSGAPDPSFGVNGELVIGNTNNEDTPLDLAFDGQGRLLLLARRFDPQASLDQQYILRILPNGTIDSTLNATGEIIVSTVSSISFNAIAADGPGAIFVGGSSPGFFTIRKFTPAGPADNNFGTSGTLNITGSSGSTITSLQLQGTQLLAAGADFTTGFVFRRAATNGAADGSFGSGGTLSLPGIAPLGDVRVDSQGRIVVFGFDSAGGVVGRFLSNGASEPGFGSAGLVSLGATQFNTMDIGPGDSIYVAGTAGSALIVRRLLGGDGSIDTTWGTGGDSVQGIPLPSSTLGVSSIATFADGSALVGGGDFETQDTFFVGRLVGATGPFATLDGRTGILTVTGTPGPDVLLIDTMTPTDLLVQLGANATMFPLAVVTLLNIDVGAGADQVTITSAINIAAAVLLGAGNNFYQSSGAGNTTITGGGGNDSINAGGGSDFVQGFGGSDIIITGLGDDVVDTGSGGDFADGGGENDSLTGGDGVDTLVGGVGNDTLFGRVGNDILDGADGDDSIVGEAGNDQISGGSGNDTIQGISGNDNINGGPGNDQVDAGIGDDFVVGAEGDDLLLGRFGNDTLIGALGNDTLDGAEDVDLLDGLEGDDLLLSGPGGGTALGGPGNDQLDGGGGNDQLDGGPGLDSLQGFGGADQIRGGDDDDLIDTGSGGDFADGNNGNDSITGGDGPDFIDGAPGNDTIFGRAGDDTLQGAEGDDFINAEDGNDQVIGSAGNDQLIGGLGADELSGSDGNDTLDAGGGPDRLFGGDDDDVLMGGQGLDVLDGQRGTDFVSGGTENDLLISDDGTTDTLNGDAGVDICRADFPGEILSDVELRYRFV